MTKGELEVLRLLMDGREWYGLDLLAASNVLSRYSIYLVLAGLQERDLVVARCETQPDRPGMPRPLYRITDAGKQAFANEEAA